MWGGHNLTPYNHSKNRPVWDDAKCHKRFEYVFLMTNWFWDGMANSWSDKWYQSQGHGFKSGVSLWGKDCWGDHNLTLYNHSKNRYTWRDVETHKRFECVFLITNWFWGGMAQVTVQQLVIISHECKVVRWKVYWKNIYGLPHIKNPYINNMCV